DDVASAAPGRRRREGRERTARALRSGGAIALWTETLLGQRLSRVHDSVLHELVERGSVVAEHGGELRESALLGRLRSHREEDELARAIARTALASSDARTFDKTATSLPPPTQPSTITAR